MKKQNLIIIACIATALVACNSNYKAKDVTLKTQEDSLNYALGVMNGESIRTYYFANDSSAKSLSKFVSAFDKAYNSEKKDQVYTYGFQVGGMLKQQKTSGLMGDSTLKYDEKLVNQGLINGMKGFSEGMTVEQAQKYLQTTMQKIQEAKMKSAKPTPVPAPNEAPTQADTTNAAPAK